MRSIILALAALAFATSVSAAGPGAVAGPYKLDASGKCHDASGKFAKQSSCAPAPPKHCRDPKTGRYAKCGAPGAVPA